MKLGVDVSSNKQRARAMVGALGVLVMTFSAGCGAGGGGRGPANQPRVVVVTKTPPVDVNARSRKLCEPGPAREVDAEHAEGSKIVEVCVTGGSPRTRAMVRKEMRLAPEAILTADALRRDLEAAYATGLLHQIEATAREYGSEVVLVLALQDRQRIGVLEFEGLVALAKDPVIASFPKPGDPLNLAGLVAAEKSLKEEYASGGWDDATITHVVAPETDGQARVTIRVVENARARVGKVIFAGAHGGREVSLRRAVELEEGAPFGSSEIERASLRVTEFYYDNGFLNVSLAPPLRTRAADGKTTVTFPITEGPMLRVGKIRIKRDVDTVTEKEILASLKTKTGDVMKRSMLIADFSAIRGLYAVRGKPVNVEPETTIDPKKAVVDIVIAISAAP